MILMWSCALHLLIPGGDAAVGTSGLYLVGGSTAEQDPPVLQFQTEHAALAVTLGKAGLEVLREDATRGEQTASTAALDLEDTALPGVRVTSEMLAESMSVGGVPQWTLWDLDTFENSEGVGGQWSANDRSTCGAPGDLFLGGHCRFSSTVTSRTYSQMPPHTRVRIRARVHFFDNWEGEAVAMQVDGATVWAKAHSWCPGFLKWMCLKYGLDSCGRDTPDKLSHKAEVTVSHSSPDMHLAFGSNLAVGSDACHASWGVDDVSVELT